MNIAEIRGLASERVLVLERLRAALDGQGFWLDTIRLLPEDFEHYASETNVRRAKIFLVLGLSLGEVLEKHNLQFIDFVRALALLMQEVESFALREPLPSAPSPSLSRKDKTRRSLFSKNGEEFTLLSNINLPFHPDYLRCLLSMLDVLHEIHARIIAYTNAQSPSKDYGPAVQEAYIKFNQKIKKILSTVQQEVESVARSKIHNELDHLVSELVSA